MRKAWGFIVAFSVVIGIIASIITIIQFSSPANSQSNHGTTFTSNSPNTDTNQLPQLASGYSGYASEGNSNTPLFLSSVTEDQQGNISGYLGKTASGSLAFKGIVTTDSRITFSVTFSDQTGSGTATYVGTVYSDGHLAGQWNATPNNSGTDIPPSNGNWNVSPV
jgi:hypothetical protein